MFYGPGGLYRTVDFSLGILFSTAAMVPLNGIHHPSLRSLRLAPVPRQQREGESADTSEECQDGA